MSFQLPSDTHIGTVSLTVSDLGRSVRFYNQALGMRLFDQSGDTARLGAGEQPWLELVQVPGARKPRGTTGLYHFAILFPSRVELAQAVRRLALNSAPFEGASDHGVSEAIYLHDPDGNGIEIYRDRLREEWPRDEQDRLEMATDPLDVDNLLDELESLPGEWPGMDAATRVGHIHLHVSNIARAEVFYTGMLGLSLMQRYGPTAAFFSAGGYHHHVAINIWNGAGAPPPPEGSAGLRYYEIVIPDAQARAQVCANLEQSGAAVEEQAGRIFFRDPAGNGIVIAN